MIGVQIECILCIQTQGVRRTAARAQIHNFEVAHARVVHGQQVDIAGCLEHISTRSAVNQQVVGIEHDDVITRPAFQDIRACPTVQRVRI